MLHLLRLKCGIQNIAQFYFTGAHLQFLEGTGLNVSKLKVNLSQG